MSPIFLFLWNLLFTVFPKAPNSTYLVTQVIDGDTFVVDNLFYIRLTNIDAPEKDTCLFTESKDYLSRLVLGRRVRLTSSTPSPDGRVLAQAYLDDQYINLEMVKSALVQYTSGDYDLHEDMIKINAANKADRQGIFSEQCLQTTNPDNPSCSIKGNVKEGHKIYSLPGCGTYSTVEVRPADGDRWFCTESAAISAGFVRSATCH